jgi:hypothetical protein
MVLLFSVVVVDDAPAAVFDRGNVVVVVDYGIGK